MRYWARRTPDRQRPGEVFLKRTTKVRHHHLYPSPYAACFVHSSASQAEPTRHPIGRRVTTRSASVASNFSTASTYDSRMGEPEASFHHGEINDLRRQLQDTISERDFIQRELAAKKEEIVGLRDRITEMKRELSEVITSKGALNEVHRCVKTPSSIQ